MSSLFDAEAFKTFQQPIKPDDFAVISALRIKIQAKNRIYTQTFSCKYLLTLSTYKWVEANSVDRDQEPSD